MWDFHSANALLKAANTSHLLVERPRPRRLTLLPLLLLQQLSLLLLLLHLTC